MGMRGGGGVRAWAMSEARGRVKYSWKAAGTLPTAGGRSVEADTQGGVLECLGEGRRAGSLRRAGPRAVLDGLWVPYGRKP